MVFLSSEVVYDGVSAFTLLCSGGISQQYLSITMIYLLLSSRLRRHLIHHSVRYKQ